MTSNFKCAYAMSLSIAMGMAAVNPFVAVGNAQPPDQRPPADPNSPSRDPVNPDAKPAVVPPASSGYVASPPGSEALAAALGNNSIELFEADDFNGSTSTIASINSAAAAGAMNEMPNGLADSLTSLRWNLNPGLIVVFYEDAAGKGEQLVIWGKGQSPSVGKWDFNDKASRWAWYEVGGSESDSGSSAAMLRPHGSVPSQAAVPENTLQLFIDQDFGNDMHQVSPLTLEKFGEMHRIPTDTSDKMSSLRWNLPPGVVVMLHQDADGDKQQIAVWGSGQVDDLDRWDFNDKASRWSWSYVGEPAAKPGSR